MTFIGNLNKKHYDIYPPQTADFLNTSPSLWLIMMANDAVCIWMPHYHEFALIQYLSAPLFLSITLSLSLFVRAPSFSHIYRIFSPNYPPHLLHVFPHCSSLICKTAHLARHREWWEEMSRSTVSSRPSHWNFNWPSSVEVEGWRDGRDEWTEEWRTTGAALLHCVFFKDVAFFFFFFWDDYSNPTKDLSAWTRCLISPPQSFSH